MIIMRSMTSLLSILIILDVVTILVVLIAGTQGLPLATAVVPVVNTFLVLLGIALQGVIYTRLVMYQAEQNQRTISLLEAIKMWAELSKEHRAAATSALDHIEAAVEKNANSGKLPIVIVQSPPTVPEKTDHGQVSGT